MMHVRLGVVDDWLSRVAWFLSVQIRNLQLGVALVELLCNSQDERCACRHAGDCSGFEH